MNRLPNFENAVIELEKLTLYCLNPEHPEGKDKAILFQKIPGVTIEHAELLKSEILSNLEFYEVTEREETKYGKKYAVLMKIHIFGNEANVLTAWIINHGINFLRLVSCYIKK